MFSVLSWVWDKEKILSHHEKLSLRSLDSTLAFSTSEPQRLYGEPSPWTTGTLWWARPMSHRDSMVSQAHEPQGLYGDPGPWSTGTPWWARPMSHRDSMVPQAHEPQGLCGEPDPLQSSYMTHVLHTARISNIYSLIFWDNIVM